MRAETRPEYKQILSELFESLMPPEEVEIRPPRDTGIGPVIRDFMYNHFMRQSQHATEPTAQDHFRFLAELFQPDIEEMPPAPVAQLPDKTIGGISPASKLKRHQHQPEHDIQKIR